MPSKGPKDGAIRRHPRKPYSDVIRFCRNPRSPNRTMKGLSINISASGMCLYSSDRLREGEEIVIQQELPVAYRKAKVVWVKDYLAGLHKVGLEFYN
jgi:c-di-GMP-binding flagellar brake protein YcgR